MLERIRERLNGWMEKIRGMGARRLSWYGLLGLTLLALGLASRDWRGKSPEAQDAPVMAAPTPAPTETLADRLTALSTPSPSPEPLAFAWPVTGEVIGEFAPEALVWSETLAQWQTHAGIDIAAEAGETVCACAEGVVSDAWEDKLWGRVIQIEHPEGYVSTYAGLSTLKLVKPGDAVAAGQTISAVGGTAACEADLPWHLHFSLEKDGEAVDFEKIVRQFEP